ncbi:hypothetical protein FQA39_LY12969 [Lamprigera yunnana]|nr:hypothetical protein FQA39_LY12969 [Lamprigera yunnana]
MAELHPLVKRVLFSEEELKAKIAEVAKEVKEYYDTQDVAENTVIFVGLLKGCIPFLQEFALNYEGNCEMEYMVISSFGGGTKATGKPKMTLDINSNIVGRDVVILDDIIDTGYTLKFVKEHLISRGAKSVKVVTLIDKPVMEKVLLTEKQLDDKCKELAKEISEFYAKKYGPTKPVVFLGLLKGCVPFMANLMKYMTIPVRTEYMVVSSYGNNTQSSKTPQILLDINNDIVDYPVLIVEDIIDTGYTLEFIKST